jgi:hypothetical protein
MKRKRKMREIFSKHNLGSSSAVPFFSLSSSPLILSVMLELGLQRMR